jgi:transposase-like protein
MFQYSPERKEALLKKLLPPLNLSVPELARQEGISAWTLYNWRKQAKAGGIPMPGNKARPDNWSIDAKFAVVVETATLSEIELSEYCRSKGLYPEQVKGWREACMAGQRSAEAQLKIERAQSKVDKLRIKELERELRRKDSALAETAALLVLRKKLNAFWSNDNEED